MINNASIEPGQHQVVNIPIGNLPSGHQIDMQVFNFRGLADGPRMLVLGGIHGDEINGVEIVKRTLTGQFFNYLQKGTAIVIPLVNIYGFLNFSRSLPDGKDVNRSFPGSGRGSLASRVASALTKKILPHIDFGVDFHTGGRSHYNYPQIRYTAGDEKARALAEVFAPPYVVTKPAIKKSLRLEAKKSGKPILVFEGGENLRYDGLSIQQGLNGLKRLLIHHGMIEGHVPKDSTTYIGESKWLRASRSGMFLWYKCSGNKVFKGEPLGKINTPYGDHPTTIYAPEDAYIIGHNNAPVVSLGDALFHLGQVEENAVKE